jgi:hypothetical protein
MKVIPDSYATILFASALFTTKNIIKSYLQYEEGSCYKFFLSHPMKTPFPILFTSDMYVLNCEEIKDKCVLNKK